MRVVRFAVLRGAGFLTGFGTGFTRTNWMGLPFARMRSSTSSSGRDARNLFRLLGKVAHVKVRVALDELVTDAGGAHPARAVVHFINKAVDDAANGIAVDGRVVPGVGAGGGLGGGGCGRGVVGLAVVEDQIQVFELVARLDEGRALCSRPYR